MTEYKTNNVVIGYPKEAQGTPSNDPLSMPFFKPPYDRLESCNIWLEDLLLCVLLW